MDPNGDGDPGDGLDGWRVESRGNLRGGFWATWNAKIREINPEALTVGWAAGDAEGSPGSNGFSSWPNNEAFFVAVTGFLVEGSIPASDVARIAASAYGPRSALEATALQNRLDAYGLERLASRIVNATRSTAGVPVRAGGAAGLGSPRLDPGYLLRAPNASERRLQRLVTLFQMTCVGAPEVYYGTETGMWSAAAPDDAQPMLWYDLEFADRAAHPRGGARGPATYQFDPDLHLYYRQAIGLRRSHPSLRRGRFEVVHVNDTDQTLAFVRALEEESLLVVLNRSEQTRFVPLDRLVLEIGEGEGLYPIFSSSGAVDASQIAMEGDHTLIIPVPARSGLVLIRTGIE
jgi:glycosidase